MTEPNHRWITHSGGKIPISRSAWIEPKFRGPEDASKGVRRAFGFAGQFAWYHDGADDDIIAYREVPLP